MNRKQELDKLTYRYLGQFIGLADLAEDGFMDYERLKLRMVELRNDYHFRAQNLMGRDNLPVAQSSQLDTSDNFYRGKGVKP